PVVAPGAQAALRGAVTWSVDWGYARARIQRPDGSIQAIAGNGDSSFGSPDQELSVLSVPMPALASLHQMSGTWDIGEYAGWRRFGMTGRLRVRTAANGALTSVASSFNAHWSLRGVDAGVAD